jgi:hypothetical protein
MIYPRYCPCYCALRVRRSINARSRAPHLPSVRNRMFYRCVFYTRTRTLQACLQVRLRGRDMFST